MNRSRCWWLRPALVGFSYGCGLLCLHPYTPWVLPGAKPVNLGEKTLLCAHLLFIRVTGMEIPSAEGCPCCTATTSAEPVGKAPRTG